MTQKLRIIFMGTPDFSVPALRALAAAHDVIAVYTQPPKPAGRGMALTQSAVHNAADDLGIPVFTPASFKREPDAVGIFQNHQADIAIVAAYGLLLPQIILDAPRYGCVNIHASLLPRWRGAAPLQRALLAGDAETGVAIMQMEAGLDTGPVWRMARIPLTDSTTLPELHDAMASLGAAEVLAALPTITDGVSAPTLQPEDGVTYAAKLTRDDGRIDWAAPAPLILRSLRALTPWPGAFFDLNADLKNWRIKILDAEIADASSAAPGTLIDKNGIIACGNNTSLRLLQVQREGKPRMSAPDFFRGLQGVSLGDTL